MEEGGLYIVAIVPTVTVTVTVTITVAEYCVWLIINNLS